MGYTHYLVRRSVEHPTVANLVKRVAEGDPQLEVPAWGKAVFGFTFLFIIVAISALEYTLKDVVATLSMVETPSAAITVSRSNESAPKDVKEEALETAPAITLVHQKPITSSIRGTIRHLVSLAGGFSRWRGIKLHLLYGISFSIVLSLVELVIPPFVPGRMIFASAISGALLANLHATWTHKVISMPTQKSLRERLVSRSNWKVLALPAAVSASSKYLSIYLAQAFVILFRLHRIDDDVTNYTGAQWASLIGRFVAVVVILVCSALFIVLPALVTLVRTEASLLPEDQDTIVPFDRTFAGKVVPKILGGSGAIGFLDAWRSFTWEARRRLIKLYLKIFAIVSAVTFIFAHVLLFQIYIIMGPAIGKYLSDVQRQGRMHN